MPRISVLTAAYAPSAHYLSETVASVACQALPPGWDIEWVIQEDGDEPSLGPLLADIPHVRYEANGLQLGIGSTRNLALARVTGELVHVLDHDDVLLPGALATLLRRFETEHIHWAVGAADDLLSDGTRRSWVSALPFGLIPAGVVNQWAEANKGNWPVHCAGLMMRTSLLRALGGWAGAPVDDDIVIFAALSEIGNGWNEEAVTWLYRQHSAQTHRSEKWKSLSRTGRLMALQRIAALRHIGLGLDARVPLQFRGDMTEYDVGPSIKEPTASGE